MSAQYPVMTIDGPSGTGKSAVSQQVAARLGRHYLDSGALYRIVALKAAQSNIAPEAEDELARLAQGLSVKFELREAAPAHIWLEGGLVDDAIRADNISQLASKIAVLPQVRQALLQKQRDFAVAPGLVAEGRDMGTVVFPDAEVKVFLTASPQKRAERRYKQLREKGFSVNLRRLLTEIQERDARDMSREVSPLRPAEAAIVVDTSEMSIEEVIVKIAGLTQVIEGAMGASGKSY